jgi:UDP-glucose:(heptosyl)LPS alpha-1,3-glucosyltransferase
MADSFDDQFHLAARYQPLARRAGLDARAIFNHPDIHIWRQLPDRENGFLDIDAGDGVKQRWHIKRFPATGRKVLPADEQAAAHQLVVDEQIPTADLVGWGSLADRRSFIIFDDLAGFTPADKLLEAGFPFDSLLTATGTLAASLHTRGLHHRDLYLCHFMVRPEEHGDESPQVRLIDTARVRALRGIFGRSRWIVKDLAQFAYSTISVHVAEAQRLAWLEHYCRQRGLPSVANLRGPVARKVNQIARHDRKLHRTRPQRNVSIPT